MESGFFAFGAAISTRHFVKARISVKNSKYHKLLLMVRGIREQLNKTKGGEENEKSNWSNCIADT